MDGTTVAVVGALAMLALGLSRKAAGAPGGVLSLSEVEAKAKRAAAFFPGVDWRMLVAMAWIESSFRPDAVRWEVHIGDASVGLVQTLSKTADWLWKDMGARDYPRPTMDSLRDPDVSLYFAAAMVNWLRTYGGRARSEEWIVRAYNGGPGGATSGATLNHWEKYRAAKARFGY